MNLRRGEVYWVDFDPALGGEIRKTRPAVIVINDTANANLNRVLVVPLTSQTGRVYPGEMVVQLRGRSSKAMADQLATASKLRFKTYIGTLSDADMISLEKVMLLQLGIRNRGAL